MSEWSKRLNQMDSFQIGDKDFKYIRQIIIQNISKITSFERKFRETVLLLLKDLSEFTFKMPPNNIELPAVGYLTMRVNKHNLIALSRLDDVRFGDEYIVVMPCVFTNDEINKDELHVDFSKDEQRPNANIFINANYPFNTTRTNFFQKLDFFETLASSIRSKESSLSLQSDRVKRKQADGQSEKFIFNRRETSYYYEDDSSPKSSKTVNDSKRSRMNDSNGIINEDYTDLTDDTNGKKRIFRRIRS